jgi:hypothetical protein
MKYNLQKEMAEAYMTKAEQQLNTMREQYEKLMEVVKEMNDLQSDALDAANDIL